MEISKELGRRPVVQEAGGFRKVVWSIERVPVRMLGQTTPLDEVLVAGVTMMSRRRLTVA